MQLVLPCKGGLLWVLANEIASVVCLVDDCALLVHSSPLQCDFKKDLERQIYIYITGSSN